MLVLLLMALVWHAFCCVADPMWGYVCVCVSTWRNHDDDDDYSEDCTDCPVSVCVCVWRVRMKKRWWWWRLTRRRRWEMRKRITTKSEWTQEPRTRARRTKKTKNASRCRRAGETSLSLFLSLARCSLGTTSLASDGVRATRQDPCGCEIVNWVVDQRRHEWPLTFGKEATQTHRVPTFVVWNVLLCRCLLTPIARHNNSDPHRRAPKKDTHQIAYRPDKQQLDTTYENIVQTTQHVCEVLLTLFPISYFLLTQVKDISTHELLANPSRSSRTLWTGGLCSVSIFMISKICQDIW